MEIFTGTHMKMSLPTFANLPSNAKVAPDTKSNRKKWDKKASAAFAELLTKVENGETQYALVDFNHYTDTCHQP